MGEEAVEEAGELAAAFNLLLDPDFFDFGTCLGAIRNPKIQTLQKLKKKNRKKYVTFLYQ